MSLLVGFCLIHIGMFHQEKVVYPLVIQRSYWKWPSVVDLPI